MITEYYVLKRPRLVNIVYDSKEANHLPTIPVLSILQFTFHSGVDVLDPSQLGSLLWRKSLKYVSTIPGFRSLYWAPKNSAPSFDQQQVMIVLVQWESGHGWKLFQSSLGFSMMLGYIKDISNRCVQLDLPNFSHFGSLLEIVSFRFSSSVNTDRESDFIYKWKETISPLLNDETTGSELIDCCGQWLEADEASEDRFFVGLLFWKPDTWANHQRQSREANIRNLIDQITDLTTDATAVVSVFTTQLNHVVPATPTLQLSSLPSDSVQSQTNHPIFKTSIKPEYNVNDSTYSGTLDLIHVKSVSQARKNPPERIACGPAGNWCPMGIISQHHLPQPGQYGTGTPGMEIISFRGRADNPRIKSSFERLRQKLWDSLGDCPGMFWGRAKDKEGDFDKISLFVETRNRNREIRKQLQRSIQEFSKECGDNIQDLSTGRSISIDCSRLAPNMDVTFFEVSENERDQESFEYAFSNYVETTHPKLVYGRYYNAVSKVTCLSRGWVTNHQSPSGQSEQDRTILQFMSVFTYEKEGAGEEWYNDFAQRAQTQYDLLGHIVDWIRTLSTRITIQRFALEKQDSWMTILREEKVRQTYPPDLLALLPPLPPVILPQSIQSIPERPPSPPPPSIFDLPWAKRQGESNERK
ncbi:conserved hypothetical protein [Talaromyces stipitatus ATCC 10500]|uniref:Uncharacterized protein n=1 Tax=Talaromyces stipitatus (strain ATCC 10500 / CBS 375.48 / QM 6759 / NRRL 1006) TaxID=441959 RepID=B8M8Y9_TALSN|nr:uncharacterized protein TSTA_111280 [Talaromyces stipitatus ATCC 10500]EED17284.1 conserved hypothetical protein [Talaromyces stipitatus ATCC 10500]